MISEKLEKARAYEAENEKKITPQMRPVFHLTPRVGCGLAALPLGRVRPAAAGRQPAGL